LAGIFGFIPLPIPFLLLIGLIIINYIILAEIAGETEQEHFQSDVYPSSGI
jgi:hypothetical protein